MTNQEGLILQGCGREAQKRIDGINEPLTQKDILLERTGFKHMKSLYHEGLTNLLFLSEGVKLDFGEPAVQRIKSHKTFGGIWLPDYTPDRLGGSLDGAPAQKTEETQQPGEHPSHSAWEGEEAGLGRMSMKQ